MRTSSAPSNAHLFLGCQLLLPVPHSHSVPSAPALLHNLWWLPVALKDYSHPPPGCWALLSPAPRTLPGVPCLGCPPLSLLPYFADHASPLDCGPTSSRNPLFLPELTSSWGLRSVPGLVGLVRSAHRFFRGLLRLFPSSGSRTGTESRTVSASQQLSVTCWNGKEGTLRGEDLCLLGGARPQEHSSSGS